MAACDLCVSHARALQPVAADRDTKCVTEVRVSSAHARVSTLLSPELCTRQTKWRRAVADAVRGLKAADCFRQLFRNVQLSQFFRHSQTFGSSGIPLFLNRKSINRSPFPEFVSALKSLNHMHQTLHFVHGAYFWFFRDSQHHHVWEDKARDCSSVAPAGRTRSRFKTTVTSGYAIRTNLMIIIIIIIGY